MAPEKLLDRLTFGLDADGPPPSLSFLLPDH